MSSVPAVKKTSQLLFFFFDLNNFSCDFCIFITEFCFIIDFTYQRSVTPSTALSYFSSTYRPLYMHDTLRLFMVSDLCHAKRTLECLFVGGRLVPEKKSEKKNTGGKT